MLFILPELSCPKNEGEGMLVALSLGGVSSKNNVKSEILNIYINITYKCKYLDKINTLKRKNKNTLIIYRYINN